MSSGYRVVQRRLLSNVVGHYEILPRNDIIFPQDFLNEIRATVIAFIRENAQNKIQISLICEMMKTDPVTGNITSVEKSAFNSRQRPVNDSTDLEDVYERMTAKILESFSNYLRNGSGWTLKRIVRLYINVSMNKPLKGSSKIQLPKELAKKGGTKVS